MARVAVVSTADDPYLSTSTFNEKLGLVRVNVWAASFGLPPFYFGFFSFLVDDSESVGRLRSRPSFGNLSGWVCRPAVH